MATYSRAFELEHEVSLSARAALIREVQLGLVIRPRSLAPWMFYDARGSRLFERITQLPEYYLTRSEHSILTNSARDIISAVCADSSRPVRLLELGAGTASKTSALLEALVREEREVFYMPLDVCADALETARERIASRFPKVRVNPLITNYVTEPRQLESFDGVTLSLYLGSSVGNFSPDEARTILKNLRSELQPGDSLLLGTDLVKDESILVPAYDDRIGITAEFNLNILRRLNRELGATFDLESFRHRVVWNRSKPRIEMHLESMRTQRVRIPAACLDLCFAAGETIHTENCHKFTSQTICDLLEDAGFEFTQSWTDARGWYALALARVP